MWLHTENETWAYDSAFYYSFLHLFVICSSNICNFLRTQWQLSLIPSSLADSIKEVVGWLAGVMAHLSIHEFPGFGIGSCLIVQYCPRSSLRSLSGSFESKSLFSSYLHLKKPSPFPRVTLCVLSECPEPHISQNSEFLSNQNEWLFKNYYFQFNWSAHTKQIRNNQFDFFNLWQTRLPGLCTRRAWIFSLLSSVLVLLGVLPAPGKIKCDHHLNFSFCAFSTWSN